MSPLGRTLFYSLVMTLSLTVTAAVHAQGHRTFETNILRDMFHYSSATPHDVPLQKLQQGCSRRDCIPAIENPKFVHVSQADFLADDDVVLAIQHNGQTKAYPTRILNYHEVVNDVVGGTPLVITFCPLCGSGIAFKREMGNKTFDFGISGLLYNSDLVMYDRNTNSLWSQLEGKAIAGQLTGTALTAYALTFARWGRWKLRHSDALVLSTDTGYNFPYQRNPYGDYAESSRIMFPVSARDARHFPKMVVYGAKIGKQYIAYDSGLLEKAAVYRDFVDQHQLQLRRTKDGSVVLSDETDHRTVTPVRLFWFAWYSFHPDTLLRTARHN